MHGSLSQTSLVTLLQGLGLEDMGRYVSKRMACGKQPLKYR